MLKVMKMPKIGVNMTEAKIVKLAVCEGDAIAEEQLILEAETDKATQEIFATMSGTIVKILIAEGDVVECQNPIMILGDTGEKATEADIAALIGAPAPAAKAEAAASPAPVPAAAPAASAVASVPATIPAAPSAAPVLADGGQRIKISPLAKKIAKENGVDPAQLSPAVPGARITKNDVLEFLKRPAQSRTTASVGEIKDTIPFTGTRKIIAERMNDSNQNRPSVGLTLHADVTEWLAFREKLKAKGVSVSYNDLMVATVAKALSEFPVVNSRLNAEKGVIELLNNINIGVAVDTEKGLLVPVIKNANQKGLLEISADFKEKAARAAEGRATADDLTGGTFTVTNLGMFEIESFIPVINPPECCILAVGAIVKEPVVEGDAVCIRPRMQMTLVFDHRIIDGAPAAKFLQRVKHLVESPLEMLL